MFEGIRTALKSQIQRAILTAEQNLDDPFAVRVLKALFLVKYVKEFKATPRNLRVLMLDQFDQDLPAPARERGRSLNLLEQQTYIQRNGEQYEFLTDEEKDVEQEIKNTEVETGEVARSSEDICLRRHHQGPQNPLRGNGPGLSFPAKLDDRLIGREQELTIHVISPFHENVGQ